MSGPSRNKNSRPVYSTGQGRIRPAPTPSTPRGSASGRRPESDGVVRLRREKKGRGGKTVVTIHGLPLGGTDLKVLATELKRRCGTGGAVKDGIFEFQGDHRDTLKVELEGRGYQVKLAGG